mmetsp:Transcript_25684/g.55253  ORF Transcript_25684/g.55253 Transcript_25684/m.55253 type:complete len:303 (-) Transcript_25684:361-1269(-)
MDPHVVAINGNVRIPPKDMKSISIARFGAVGFHYPKPRVQRPIVLVGIRVDAPRHLVHVADIVGTYFNEIPGGGRPSALLGLINHHRTDMARVDPGPLKSWDRLTISTRLEGHIVHGHGPITHDGTHAHNLILAGECKLAPVRPLIARVRSGQSVLVNLEGAGVQPAAEIFAMARGLLGIPRGNGRGHLGNRPRLASGVSGRGSKRCLLHETSPRLRTGEFVLVRGHVVFDKVGIWQGHRAKAVRAAVIEIRVLARHAFPIVSIVGASDGDVESAGGGGVGIIVAVGDGEEGAQLSCGGRVG